MAGGSSLQLQLRYPHFQALHLLVDALHLCCSCLASVPCFLQGLNPQDKGQQGKTDFLFWAESSSSLVGTCLSQAIAVDVLLHTVPVCSTDCLPQ